ncbi:DegT/DnrJ/EryC1/StrS family aminotransferase [Providencia sp. PROV083]|uniref:DegT/DnrJ/EryC1/StrS family aminotransferase n=1 Tax=Providencia sp. PROV083 TaxID=2936783 RepID=UPI00298F7347|nr:DegT/DnrJ/EryC1/StrS family aminotransferase [Providencia sp. PROV083]
MSTFFLNPVYRISPFTTSDYAKNIQRINARHEHEHEHEKLIIKNGYNTYFTESGRQAIQYYLASLQLNCDDEVTIITTTSSYYISSCVTATVEKYCKWNRQVTNKTKCIIVIHEFGKLYENVQQLLQYNIPILEDFAHSFSALTHTENIHGDAAIFSLSKFLPINSGGLILSKAKLLEIKNSDEYCYFYKIYSNKIPIFIRKRKLIENYYIKKFQELNLRPYFTYRNDEAPGVFVVNINKPIDYLQKLKIYLQREFR